MHHLGIAAAGLIAAAGSTLGIDTAPGAVPHPRRGPVETSVIARSGRGAAIGMWRLGTPELDEFGRGPDQRPAVLIVAGIDGRHDFGSRVAISLVDRLLPECGDLLDRYTVYIVPDINPDNDALFVRSGIPRAEFCRAPRSNDADHDGRSDEDGADDLNGDGIITMMRVKNPSSDTGLRPSLVLDPDEPRTLRAPDAARGEIAEYALLVEGIDNDGDGKYNEDGIAGSAGGGVDLDMNFPSLWPEHKDGAGRYPLSEPETRGLVEWLMARDNILCALTYSPHDNILNTPATGQYAADGREPTGIDDGDQTVYGRVAEAFKEATKETEAPKGDWAGSFTQYAYAHLGVWSFATPAWVRPDQLKPDGPPEEGGVEGNERDGADQRPRRSRDGGGGGRDPQAERQTLQRRGVPGFAIDFILATPDERAATMEQFGALPPEEQQSRMLAVAAMPEDVQLRMRALIAGQPDPSPGAGNGGPSNRQAQPPPSDGQQPAGQPSGGQPTQGGPPAGGPPGGAFPGGRSGRFGGRGGRAGPPPAGTELQTGAAPSGDEAEWIKYSDEHLDGKGFVEWATVRHPQLGEVEVGGLVPGIRHEPPESEWTRIVDEQTKFVAKLLTMMPDLKIDCTRVERVTDGVWRVRVRATNPGELPTRAAIGVKARRIPPIVLSLGVPPDDILSGRPNESWDTIPGMGGYEETEWLFKAPDGATVPVEVRSTVFGNRTLTIELKEGE